MATVKDLIEALQEQPADRIVVLALDGEGNAFREADALLGWGYWDEGGQEYDGESDEDANSVTIWPVY